MARGPGSFTGVRVALSVAKGMAAGLGIPAWGVGSLDVLALAAQPASCPCGPWSRRAAGATRRRCTRDGSASRASRAWPRSSSSSRSITVPTIVIGELRPDERATPERQQQRATAGGGGRVRARAGFLAELGWRLAQAGVPGDARSLDAVYVT